MQDSRKPIEKAQREEEKIMVASKKPPQNTLTNLFNVALKQEPAENAFPINVHSPFPTIHMAKSISDEIKIESKDSLYLMPPVNNTNLPKNRAQAVQSQIRSPFPDNIFILECLRVPILLPICFRTIFLVYSI